MLRWVSWERELCDAFGDNDPRPGVPSVGCASDDGSARGTCQWYAIGVTRISRSIYMIAFFVHGHAISLDKPAVGSHRIVYEPALQSMGTVPLQSALGAIHCEKACMQYGFCLMFARVVTLRECSSAPQFKGRAPLKNDARADMSCSSALVLPWPDPAMPWPSPTPLCAQASNTDRELSRAAMLRGFSSASRFMR